MNPSRGDNIRDKSASCKREGGGPLLALSGHPTRTDESLLWGESGHDANGPLCRLTTCEVMTHRLDSRQCEARGLKQDHNTVSDDLKFQLRLTLSDEFAQVARNVPGNPLISTLTDILNRHDAVMKCQFDAFADYVSEAEANGIENFHLYEWTKKTIDDPASSQNTPSLSRFMSGAARSTKRTKRTR